MLLYYYYYHFTPILPKPLSAQFLLWHAKCSCRFLWQRL